MRDASPLRIGARRKAVDLGRVPQVRLVPGTFPLEGEPDLPGTDLSAWAAEFRDTFSKLLARHGALAFRGFGLSGPAELQRFAEAAATELYADYGDLPRDPAGGKVYGTTPYPAERAIHFHNESAHQHRFPRRLFFLCLTPPASGGATPLVDGRRVLGALSAPLAARFARLGLRYVRTFTRGVDVPWQDFFRTADRAAVEERCRESGASWEWRGDTLRVTQGVPAVIRHPETGERALFQQVLLHHPSRLDPEAREALGDEIPRDVTWGDGSPIAAADVDELAATLEGLAVDPPWRAGDVLVLDNLLVCHGRRAFTGARRVVVAMGNMTSFADLPEAP